MDPSMLPLLAVLALGPVPAAEAAEAYPKDACSYLEDVRGIPKTDCVAGSGRISGQDLAEAVRGAPDRKLRVEDLARRLAEASSPGRMHELLVQAAPLLSPPLNRRTFPAWLEPEAPLLRDARAAAALDAWLSARGESVVKTAPREGLLPAGSLSRQFSELKRLDEADAAALAMDGSVRRKKADLAVVPGLPEGKAGGDAGLSGEPLPRLSDLKLKEPPSVPPHGSVTSDDIRVQPIVTPGEKGAHESLFWSIDPKADPCVDFFQFACGRWVKDHPLEGRANRNRFGELGNRNAAQLRVIVQRLAAAPSQDATEKKLGDYFSACMDEKAIEARGIKPLLSDLERFVTVSGPEDLARAVAYLHAQGLPALFGFGSQRDPKDASRIIAAVTQAGITLPREYYLEDAHRKQLAAYTSHIRTMFASLGYDKRRAVGQAAAVVRLETALARGSMPKEQTRDPAAIHHPMPVSGLEAMTPSFPWQEYLLAIKAPPIQEINVLTPGFFTALEALFRTTAADDWKDYLRWKTLNASAQQLPADIARKDLKFENTLYGSEGFSPRWRTCLTEIEGAMGQALGQAYVRQHFDERGKRVMAELARGVKAALKEEVENASWMTPETRQHALRKVDTLALKVGYPDQPRDFGGLAVSRGDAFGNARRAGAFHFRRDLDKIGRPVDKGEWEMTPQSVNAYYMAENNEIVFPAGILQPPFFDPEGAPAANFGAIGAIVGHEMIHGFDDGGRRYDADGNMKDWWVEKDAASFQSMAQGFVKQYAGYSQIPGQTLPVNSVFTLGENIADNGGLRLAYKAFQNSPGKKSGSEGFPPEQAFFLNYGRIWCGHETEELARLSAATDPHPPNRVRVNGAVSNMPEFRQAFRCGEGSPMAVRTPARVW